MTTNPPGPAQTPGQAVQTSVVRGITVWILAGIAYALSKANIHISNTYFDVAVNTLVSTAVAAAYTFIGRWLETFKSSRWGKLFLIARAPFYSTAPTPAVSATVPTDPQAGVTFIEICVGVIAAVAVIALAVAALGHGIAVTSGR